MQNRGNGSGSCIMRNKERSQQLNSQAGKSSGIALLLAAALLAGSFARSAFSPSGAAADVDIVNKPRLFCPNDT